MMIGELINLVDLEINTAKADSVVEVVRVESYYRGKTDGLQGMRNKLVEVINKEYEAQQEAQKEEPTPADETKPAPKKKQ